MTLSDERLYFLQTGCISGSTPNDFITKDDIRTLISATRRLKEVEADLKAALDRNCQHVEELTRTETERDALKAECQTLRGLERNTYDTWKETHKLEKEKCLLEAERGALQKQLHDTETVLHDQANRNAKTVAERDALTADNARLRRAVEMASGHVLNRGQRLTPTDRQRLYRLLQEALASTPEASLAAHDRQVLNAALDEAAVVAGTGYPGDCPTHAQSEMGDAIASAIRALKTEPDK